MKCLSHFYELDILLAGRAAQPLGRLESGCQKRTEVKHKTSRLLGAVYLVICSHSAFITSTQSVLLADLHISADSSAHENIP